MELAFLKELFTKIQASNAIQFKGQHLSPAVLGRANLQENSASQNRNRTKAVNYNK